MVEKFGTDGLRGKFEDLSLKGIAAVARELSLQTQNQGIFVGYDTRESSSPIKESIKQGIGNAGGIMYDLGIIPTPGVSSVIASRGNGAGIMITASHNPPEYNGIKIFTADGHKLSESQENYFGKVYLEEYLGLNSNKKIELKSGKKHKLGYVHKLKSLVSKDLDLKLAIDCANGAASYITQKVFENNSPCFISNLPNSNNINLNCGATNLNNLEKIVLANSLDLGIAFDGDADRVCFVDENGKMVDGDYIMAFVAKQMMNDNTLKNNTLVVTEYSNYALDKYIKSLGGNVIRVPNGDKYITRKLKEINGNLGGEVTGHLIFDTSIGSGDGIYSAIKVLSYLDKNRLVSEQLRDFELNPQTKLNIPIKRKESIQNIYGLSNKISQYQKELNDIGRILVRPSGTEMIYRVLVESPNKLINEEIAEELKLLIVNQLN